MLSIVVLEQLECLCELTPLLVTFARVLKLSFELVRLRRASMEDLLTKVPAVPSSCLDCERSIDSGTDGVMEWCVWLGELGV